MNTKVFLTSGALLMTLTTSIVHAVNINTAAVSTGKPVDVGNRNIWCVSQNLTTKRQTVTAELWDANLQPPATEPRRTATYNLEPNQTSGYTGPGASKPYEGGIQVYCRFKVKTKKVRGSLTIEDDNATVLVTEAK